MPGIGDILLHADPGKQLPEIPDALPGLLLVHAVKVPEALRQRRTDHPAEVLVVILLNALAVQRMTHAGGDPLGGIGDGSVQIKQDMGIGFHR